MLCVALSGVSLLGGVDSFGQFRGKKHSSVSYAARVSLRIDVLEQRKNEFSRTACKVSHSGKRDALFFLNEKVEQLLLHLKGEEKTRDCLHFPRLSQPLEKGGECSFFHAEEMRDLLDKRRLESPLSAERENSLRVF